MLILSVRTAYVRFKSATLSKKAVGRYAFRTDRINVVRITEMKLYFYTGDRRRALDEFAFQSIKF